MHLYRANSDSAQINRFWARRSKEWMLTKAHLRSATAKWKLPMHIETSKENELTSSKQPDQRQRAFGSRSASAFH